MKYNFPKNFYWGTATSAYQVEGNNKNSDWWQAEQKGKIPHKSEQACDSYNRYEEDFDLAKELGTNAHRLSIEWSRIEPQDGKFNEVEIEHYRKVIRALKDKGIEPFVTLHHFTNPLWFADKGGWDNPRSPFYFARYAEYIVKSIPEVKFWITINEPNVYATMSFWYTKWPPYKNSIFSAAHVLYNMVHAHKAAYKKIKTVNGNAQVGIAKSIKYFVGYKKRFFPRVIASIFSYIINLWFLERINYQQDFIGVNYYYPVSIKPGFNSPQGWMKRLGNNEISDFGKIPAYENYGWEIYPEGLYYVVKHAAEFEKPIYVFENGIADANDTKRSDFIKEHLKYLHKAIKEGADVKGYFYWSLLDNFEWSEGFDMKFGLIEVNFKTFERKPRDSFYVYKEICSQNALNDKLPVSPEA